MESIWNGYIPYGMSGFHMDSIWNMFYHISHILLTWIPPGIHMDSTWIPDGFHVHSIWTGSIWIPSGFHVDS